MVPLRIVIITKTDPLKKSLPKFAQPGAGCYVWQGLGWDPKARIQFGQARGPNRPLRWKKRYVTETGAPTDLYDGKSPN